MSGRTQFVIGSVMLALAIGLVVGVMVAPRGLWAADGGGAEGRTMRYALVTGITGTTPGSETVYLLDEANDLLIVYEYSSRSRELVLRTAGDIRRVASQFIKARAHKAEKEAERVP